MYHGNAACQWTDKPVLMLVAHSIDTTHSSHDRQPTAQPVLCSESNIAVSPQTSVLTAGLVYNRALTAGPVLLAGVSAAESRLTRRTPMGTRADALAIPTQEIQRRETLECQSSAGTLPQLCTALIWSSALAYV